MRYGYSIGDLAHATGCKVQTIRYYEQIGLMPAPSRTEGGQRRYGIEHHRRLAFIRHARDLGFDIAAIRQLLALADQPNRSCADVDKIARSHLHDINGKIARLAALQTEVRRMIARCKRGRIGDCRVIEVLADHDQCLHDRH